MSAASRFVFDMDFANPGRDARHRAELAEVEARARAEGHAAGLSQAAKEQPARLADAMARLADAASRLLADADRYRETLEDEAIAFGLQLGRKLAGEALAQNPLASVEETARAAFQHLRGVPHLVVRINDGHVEEVDAMIHRMSRERGYEGRVVVLGDPEIAIGDVRLEWADGGISRERNRIEDAVTAALAPTASSNA